MENQTKFVDFETYCDLCKFKELNEHLDPCNECLDVKARVNTSVPEYWEAAKGK